MVIKRLRRRFIFINMALVSLVLIGIFIANTISISNQVASNSYANLNEAMRRTDPNFHDGAIPQKDTTPKAFPQDIIWLRLEGDNRIIMNIENAPDYTDEYIKEIVANALETNKSRSLLREYNLRFSLIKTPNGDTMLGFIDVSYEQNFIYNQTTDYLYIGLGSLAVFFIISFFLSKLVIKPVDRAFKQQQQFISDASHELKTPITIILANTSIIQTKKGNTDTNKWIGYIEKEATRMKKLVEDLLFLARLDEDQNKEFKSIFNLSDILYECVLPYEPVAFESGISIKSEIASSLFVRGNIDQIKRLIMILLDNACKYSPKGNEISVILKSSNSKAILTVYNEGEVIPPEDTSKIFNRFYRVDKARERNNNSYGLGLPMAKKIVEDHKGNITVESSENNGTTFTVILSLSNQRNNNFNNSVNAY